MNWTKSRCTQKDKDISRKIHIIKREWSDYVRKNCYACTKKIEILERYRIHKNINTYIEENDSYILGETDFRKFNYKKKTNLMKLKWC